MKYFFIYVLLISSNLMAGQGDFISNIELEIKTRQSILSDEEKELRSPIRCAIRLDREEIESADECDIINRPDANPLIQHPQDGPSNFNLRGITPNKDRTLELLEDLIRDSTRQMGGGAGGVG